MRDMSKETESCCNEETQKSFKPEVHVIPALSHPAPSWSGVAVIDLKFRDLSLKHFKGKYLVLLFYPYDFTFVCPTELIQFSDRVEEFRNLGGHCVKGTEVVAVSTDSEYSHLAWIITPRKQGGLGEMNIPVLTDKNHEISKKYGVLNQTNGISLKALFIIDQNQLIRHVTINEISLPRCVDEILRLLRACQFVDKYGDTCPIGPKEKELTSEAPNYFNVT